MINNRQDVIKHEKNKVLVKKGDFWSFWSFSEGKYVFLMPNEWITYPISTHTCIPLFQIREI